MNHAVETDSASPAHGVRPSSLRTGVLGTGRWTDWSVVNRLVPGRWWLAAPPRKTRRSPGSAWSVGLTAYTAPLALS